MWGQAEGGAAKGQARHSEISGGDDYRNRKYRKILKEYWVCCGTQLDILTSLLDMWGEGSLRGLQIISRSWKFWPQIKTKIWVIFLEVISILQKSTHSALQTGQWKCEDKPFPVSWVLGAVWKCMWLNQERWHLENHLNIKSRRKKIRCYGRNILSFLPFFLSQGTTLKLQITKDTKMTLKVPEH